MLIWNKDNIFSDFIHISVNNATILKCLQHNKRHIGIKIPPAEALFRSINTNGKNKNIKLLVLALISKLIDDWI